MPGRPKGVAALYKRPGVQLAPWQHGGGHEFGLRSTTENVPGIVGFAMAAALCEEELAHEAQRQQRLRDTIFEALSAAIPATYINGHRTQRLPSNVNVGFAGYEGQAPVLLAALDERGFSVSTGSACSSNAQHKSSHVLKAIGRNPVEAIGALRVTLGRFTTADDVERFVAATTSCLRALKPM